ncbi:MAG: hypothetical protein OXD54_17335 [Candidatus Poribacteria bacterium]|nr:hypothetical protein [Candidatus Poribacteria bacterium]
MKDTLSRRLLPFYMKLPIFWAFIIVTFLGEVLWITVVSKGNHTDLLSWSCFGYAAGIVLGFMQGKWTSRLWEHSYLQVLKRELTFWEAKGAKSLTFFTCIALGLPILGAITIETTANLVGIQSYIFGFVGAMNVALLLWVRRIPK